jgi:PGF-CTERM protein
MEDALDDLGRLVTSPNRIATLRTLSRGPAAPEQIRSEIGGSRSRTWRVLTNLKERGWIEKSSETYEITSLGQVIFDSLPVRLEAISAANRLEDADVLQWLPIETFRFELSQLADATLVTPTASDPQAPMRRAVSHVESSTRIRLLTHAAAPEVLHAIIAGDTKRNWTSSSDHRRGSSTSTAASPGLSVFALGSAPRGAAFAVTDPALSATSATVGESVAVTATVTNTGGERGTTTVDLLVDGTVPTSKTVELGESAQTVRFVVPTDEAGTYRLAVGEADAGTLAVASDPTAPTTRTRAETGSQQTTATSAPGFGVVVAVVSVVLLALVGRLRRRRGR